MTKTTRCFIALFILLLAASPLSAQNLKKQIRNLEELTQRTMGGLSSKVEFTLEPSEDTIDYVQITSHSDKLKITANRPTSAAWGLSWYSKYALNSSISWCGDAVKLPSTLPEFDTTLRTNLTEQFNYNYCTFGYTMLFWGWEQWEREIDLMALSGVTTPLAMVGAELVWIETLEEFGYTKEQALEFLTGPAFLPWLLMGNMEKEGGPLPQHWLDAQLALQKKILARMREYGMTPVLQGFYGMVPQFLNNPAMTINQGTWNDLERPLLLAPTDPLFDKFADAWYRNSEKLFGKVDYYAGDLFHEGGHSGNLNVGECAGRVQSAMQRNSPGSKWVIQSWGGNPSKALLSGLNPEHTIIVDICAEYWDRWHEREGFEGFPWVWGHITNWGGNIGSHGRLEAIASEPLRARNDPKASRSMVGIGAFPEGTEVNPVTFDLANEMRWHQEELDLEQWIAHYAKRRYNTSNETLQKSWKVFLNTIYGTWDGGRRPSESVFCAPPSLKGEAITASAWSQCKIYYDPKEFAQGVKLFLSEAESFAQSETYQYDAVDLVRQYIDDLAREAYYEFVEHYKNGNTEEFEKWSARFLELLSQQDRLLSTHPMFHVGRWLDFARNYSDDPQTRKLYEYNARLLIGTWTQKPSAVRDYGHRTWGGMLEDYYLPRWSTFIEHLKNSTPNAPTLSPSGENTTQEEGTIHGGQTKNLDTINQQLFEMERKWILSNNHYEFDSNQDAVTTAKSIFEKYYNSNPQ